LFALARRPGKRLAATDAIPFSGKQSNRKNRLVTRERARAMAGHFFSLRRLFRHRLEEPEFTKD